MISITLGGPIYALSRIILPEWIKAQIASSLPSGSTLSVGSISSDHNLSITYENVNFKSRDGSFKLYLDNLVVSPRLSLKEPIILSSQTATIETKDLTIKLSDFKSNFMRLQVSTL